MICSINIGLLVEKAFFNAPSLNTIHLYVNILGLFWGMDSNRDVFSINAMWMYCWVIDVIVIS